MSAQEGSDEFAADAAVDNNGIKILKAEGDENKSNSAHKMKCEMHRAGLRTEGSVGVNAGEGGRGGEEKENAKEATRFDGAFGSVAGEGSGDLASLLKWNAGAAATSAGGSEIM
jgi:hypothetical protein